MRCANGTRPKRSNAAYALSISFFPGQENVESELVVPISTLVMTLYEKPGWLSWGMYAM